MTDVFISYSRADRNRVRFIAHALTAEGFNVWWDPEIKPGAQWNTAIRRALENAACVLTCWSKKSVKSQWVVAETTHGHGRQALVPVLIQTCEPPIPFNMMQAADLSGWRGDGSDPEWQGVLEQVRRLVEAKRRLAAAGPPPGEAHGAVRAAAPAPTAAEEVFRYTPSPRRFGPRFGQMLLGGVVVTAVLTAGVFFAPQVADRFAPRSDQQATAPPVTEAQVPTEPLPADQAPALETPETPFGPPAQETPSSSAPPAGTSSPPPSSTPTPPSAVTEEAAAEAALDACANRLIALCPGFTSLPRGFAGDGRLSALEATFLSNLQIAPSPPTTQSAEACRGIVDRRSSGAIPARRTLYDQTCENWVGPSPSPSPPTATPTTPQGPSFGEAVIDALPGILEQTRNRPPRWSTASISPSTFLNLAEGGLGRTGDVAYYTGQRAVTVASGATVSLWPGDGRQIAALGRTEPTRDACENARYGTQAQTFAAGADGLGFCVRLQDGRIAGLQVQGNATDNGLPVRYGVWD